MKNNMNSQLQLQRNKYSDFQSGCLSMMQYISSFKIIAYFSQKVKPSLNAVLDLFVISLNTELRIVEDRWLILKFLQNKESNG